MASLKILTMRERMVSANPSRRNDCPRLRLPSETNADQQSENRKLSPNDPVAILNIT
jgi:hypothetical protein